MTKSTILRYASIGIAAVGFAGVAAASSVTLSGPNDHGSSNKVTVNSGSKVNSSTFNATGVGNFNGQGSFSGSAKADNNTTVGSVGSGDAANTNTTTTTVTNSGNSMSGWTLGNGGSDSTVAISGPNDNGSHNTVTLNDGDSVKVNTVNLTEVSNTSIQLSATGNASAHNNTTSGDVTTGSASNMNTTMTTVSNNQ